MYFGEWIEFLGWVTAVSFGVAILNFFVKYFNRVYISHLAPEKQEWATLYRKGMKWIVKYHKLAGATAVAAVLTHFFMAFTSGMISLTGILSAVIMGSIFFLGAYGAFINKNYKGLWLKAHRMLAFSLILTIGIHILVGA